MTLEPILPLVLAMADDSGCIIDHTACREWPEGVVDLAVSMNLLREAVCGLTAPCPSCPDRHVEDVHSCDGPDGQLRHFIICDEAGRHFVTRDMCRGWELNLDGFARVVGRALELSGSPKEVVPNRLWRLGRIPWEGKTRGVMLAMRLADPDGASVAVHVGVGGRSVVLVPRLVPDERVWPGRVPAVVSLEQIAELEGDRLVIDGVAFMETVAEADAVAESKSLLPIDPEIKKRVVRRQVKAEIKGHLEDDVLVGGYAECNSLRGAARLLTDRLGRPVSKDQVYRAVQRAGGVKAVKRTEDSPSVARTVASQSRDRAKIFSQYR